MTTRTPYFGLLELGPNDPFSSNNYEFSTSDVVAIDALLYDGTTSHHHDGLSSSVDNPGNAPSLTPSTSGGSLPPGTTIYYEYTYVNPLGLETGPSPIGSVTTTAPVSTPSPPSSVVPTTGTGTLIPGTYNYELTAYVSISTQETLPSGATAATLTATGEQTVHMPSVPSGATGFNIYRKGPSETTYLYLTSIPSATTSYVDNGSMGANCNRFPPTVNTTNAQNEVAGTIVAPVAGWTANVYRTTNSGQWGSSQIATGITGTSFTDTGATPVAITPPTTSRVPSDPTKILLTGGAEVQGILPMAYVQAFPVMVIFSFPGSLSVEQGLAVWVCEFTTTQIISCRASLGRGFTPAAHPVIVDIQKGAHSGGNPPTYSSIFAAATPVYPEVQVGQEIGTSVTPTVNFLNAGDALTASILQTGGGATPTDGYLTINVYMWVNP